MDRGAITNNPHLDPMLEVTLTGIRTKSQAMPKGKAKVHLYEQTILIQYVVSMGTILTTVLNSLSLKSYKVTKEKEGLPNKLQ